MEDSEAEALRARFETLADTYRITLEDVNLVPAVLGRAINWSHSHSEDRLLALSAYDEPVATVGDLRRLLAEHPRGEAEDNSWAPVGNAIAEALRGWFHGPLREITELRIRFRVLYEIMQEKDENFALDFARRYWQALDRDFEAINTQARSMLNTDEQVQEFRENFKEWITADEARQRKLLGDKLSDQLGEEWKRRLEAFQKKSSASNGSDSSDKEQTA